MNLPPVALVVLVAITAMLWVGTVLLWVQAYRAPENVPVRILAVCITLLAVTAVLRGGPFLSPLVNNVLGVMTAAIQICFFVSVHRGRAGTRRIRGELAVAVAVCVLAAAVTLVVPASLRPQLTDATPAAGGTAALLFSIPILVYLGYAAAAIVVWILKILPGVARRVLRISLWIVAAGAVLQVAGGGIRVASLLLRYAVRPVPEALLVRMELLVGLLVSLGFLTLALGAIVPLVDGVIREIPRMRAQRRANRTLEPLWQALHAEFPELQLELRSPGPGRALYRRVVEIRDGLVLLSPHFDPEVADAADRRSDEIGEDPDERQAAVQAAVVRGALDARRTGRQAPAEPVRLGGGQAQDWEDDAASLMRLARRFAAPV
ncbi:MAB_1171c family putative transporter [Pseudonocardia endophytica]|uniref:DUF6545 domain-containing protein n=1 Tax=Pseudonocardia endophytica TaxID=401976 RepID=A0A4R1HTV7_PSEEN|nr:MAB_1171c family putative transporter [Pseudonocardia endophytica]TCK20862.1 hypothetical protein EV378_4826 [Pseudonocardia endophytica]